jgi:hypothetical protein
MLLFHPPLTNIFQTFMVNVHIQMILKEKNMVQEEEIKLDNDNYRL